MFSSLCTPTIASVSPREGIATTSLTITGTSLDINNCQSEVWIGDHSCNILDSNTNRIICQLQHNNTAPIKQCSRVRLRINNMGYPCIRACFMLNPHMTISPSSGSTCGGTVLTISGAGFVGGISTTAVVIGTSVCIIQSVTYTQIICITQAAPASPSPLNVTATVSSGILVECSDCKFRFVDGPTVTAISPSTVSGPGPHTLTLTGTGLGNDKSKLHISVGGTVCVVQSISGGTSATCIVGLLVWGLRSLAVNMDGVGIACVDPSLRVTVTSYISSITPTQGSLLGGTTITINGGGFNTNGQTSVTVGGKSSQIISVQLNQIVCIIPSTTQGGTLATVGIDVTTNPTFTVGEFNYTMSRTPQVTGMNDTSGTAGDIISITGTGFSNNIGEVTVTMSGVRCTIVSSTTTEINAIIPILSATTHSVEVRIKEWGFGNSSLTYTSQLFITNITPNQGKDKARKTKVLFLVTNTPILFMKIKRPCAS